MTLRTPLPPPLATFFNELAADHAFGEGAVAPMRAAASALSIEADDCYDALMMLQAISLVAAQRRPVRDRFTDIAEIASARGRVIVTIRNPTS
jgi:hypothetical protein